MSPLLASTVVGPLTPGTSSVVVTGVLPDAIVEVLADGSPVGYTAALSTSVSIVVRPLQPGQRVTSRWMLGGEQSLPPPVGEIVLGWPAQLGALTFDSPVHTAIDWLTLRGAYAGAEVTVTDRHATVIGREGATGLGVRIGVIADFEAGYQLRAVQRLRLPNGNLLESPQALSVRAERFNTETSPPTPVLPGPIFECDGAVLVSNIVPGCTVRLTTPNGDRVTDATGTAVWFSLPEPVRSTDSFIARNVLQRENMVTIPSAPVGVAPGPPPLPRPHIDSDLACASLQFVQLSNLRPRCELRVELLQRGATKQIGRCGGPEAGTTATVPIPDLSQYAASPPSAQLRVVETLCKQTAVSNLKDVGPPARMDRPRLPGPLAACAEFVYVENVTGYAELRSNAADGPHLSSPTPVHYADWLPTNRPLRPREQIIVRTLTGCAARGRQDSHPFISVEEAKAPVAVPVAPIRPNHAHVGVAAVAGGQVHVYVNGLWRASAPARGSASVVRVWVGRLYEEDLVQAREALCGRLGPMSARKSVRTGAIVLTVEPLTVTVGTDVEFVCSAIDKETKQPLQGLVRLNGKPFTGTDQPARLHIKDEPHRLTMSIDGYREASVDLKVEKPKTPPPKSPPRSGCDLRTVIDWVQAHGTTGGERNNWVQSGDSFSYFVTITNDGPDPAGPFRVAFFLDDEPDGDEDVAGLAVGGGEDVEHAFGALRDGSYGLRALVDPDRSLNDPQRGNNETISTAVVGLNPKKKSDDGE
jgi:hypothetical protein